MNQRSSILAILNEFLTRYPKQFGLLFILLVIEGLTAAVSVLAIVPLADYMLDTSLAKPSQITRIVIDGMHLLGMLPEFWTLGILFVALNFLKGLMEVAIRYAILRIKYAVLEGLLGDALITFFKSRWEFFSGSDQGRILNSLNREINTIGDTLGHIATLLAQIIQLVIYLAVPLMLNAQLTLTSLGLAILLG